MTKYVRASREDYEQHVLHGLSNHNSSGYTECGAGTGLVAAGGRLSSLFL